MATNRLLQRLIILAASATLAACSTMQATQTGHLTDRSQLNFNADGSTGQYRATIPINPHQIVSTTVDWVTQGSSDLTESEKTQLLASLSQALSTQLAALPPVAHGRPVMLRAAITRVEVVSPGLNTLATVLLIGPLDRGGAAVELELLDAQTRLPLASMATATFTPLSEFKARFSRLAPAELALNNAASEFAKLVRGSPAP